MLAGSLQHPVIDRENFRDIHHRAVLKLEWLENLLNENWTSEKQYKLMMRSQVNSDDDVYGESNNLISNYKPQNIGKILNYNEQADADSDIALLDGKFFKFHSVIS